MLSASQIECLLQRHNIFYIRSSLDNESLKRSFKIEGLGDSITLHWYANNMTIVSGNLNVFVDDIDIINSWPNKYKTNLVGLNKNRDIILVFPLERY